ADYEAKALAAAKQQLAKSGVRLAQALRDSFKWGAASVGRAVAVGEDAAAVAPERGEIIVRIGDFVARPAVADFQIDDVAAAAVDEAMAIRLAGRKARRHAGPEHPLAGIGQEGGLAFEHHHELVFQRMPMAQRR